MNAPRPSPLFSRSREASVAAKFCGAIKKSFLISRKVPVSLF
jgi:hypothetical protein